MRYDKQKEKASTKARKGQTKEMASLESPFLGGFSFGYRERTCFHSLNYLWVATTQALQNQ